MPELKWMEVSAWGLRAACRNHDPELWFPTPGDGRTRRRAQAICRTCPVVTQCGSFALTTGEPEGIWGGLTSADRSRILGIPARCRMNVPDHRQPCGTYAAYRRHKARDEKPCPPCESAKDTYNMERAAQKRKAVVR